MIKEIVIGGRKIGLNQPPYIVAELSANHNGSLNTAKNLIETAKTCGADAVKIQSYTPETMTIDCDKEEFQVRGGLWDGYSLYRLYQWAQTPFEWHKNLYEYAKKIGITIFSTPFDETAVDLLENLNNPAYKIASFEAIDLPLIKYVAQTKKPLIISTGMSNLDEITEAVETARENGCSDLVLLHCISGYPTPIDQSNLRTIPDLSQRFGVIAGLSDHTLGTTVSIASVSLGACMIEKHVTLDRLEKTADNEFSLEPTELKHLCMESEKAWLALGNIGYDRKPVEEESIKYRRSIYVVADIKAGEAFTTKNIRRIRPGFGLSPRFHEIVLGRRAACDLERGTALKLEHVAE